MQPENNTKCVYIYTLNDPDTNDVRYVGKTQQLLRDRYHNHIQSARCGRGGLYGVLAWIRSLLLLGKRPTINVIETATADTWEESERRWIAHFWNNGATLTNVMLGGQHGAPVGMTHTAFTRARLAEKGRNISEETRAKRSAARKGRKLPPELRVKLSESHKGKSNGPCSESTKQKIGAANKGNKGPRGLKRPPETLAKMSIAQRQNKLALSRSKISDAKVNELRERYCSSDVTIGELVKQYRISELFVWRLVHGQTRQEAGGPIYNGIPVKKQLKCRSKATQILLFDTAKTSSAESK